MFRRGPFPVKSICLWFTVIALVLSVSYIIFISIISIKVGLNHLNQDGFIVPVLAGVFAIVVCIFIFICFMKFIISLMKEKDIFRPLQL